MARILIRELFLKHGLDNAKVERPPHVRVLCKRKSGSRVRKPKVEVSATDEYFGRRLPIKAIGEFLTATRPAL